MWDYDKLFAEGNIVGIKILSSNKVYNYVVDNRSIGNNNFWSYYKNNNLRDKDDNDFEIQYIIRLDEHGDAIEKIFDRDKDIPKPMPELETGMFVAVIDNKNMFETTLGYVDAINNRIVYQDGSYNGFETLKNSQNVDIVEIYPKETSCFNRCKVNIIEPIWREPKYQKFLDSKSN